MRPDLSVVVPLKDEQEVVESLFRRLTETLDSLPLTSEIVFVDDGSRDATPVLLAALVRRDLRVRVIRLSRNFGHQAAVCAGLDHARGHAVVLMDGDLQDPPELIPKFLEAWREGNDVVYAVRTRRAESWPLRFAYSAFYRLLRGLSELDMPLDSGDFCLMDRRVVRALRALPERSRFVRGLRRFVGFRQCALNYDRPARACGRSKYTLPMLLRLASEGIVGFSGRPLRLATYLGLTTALLAVAITAWVVVDAIVSHTAPKGWASTMVVVLFMGAVQLVCVGILGEYLRQVFVETKRRPTYIVEHRLGRCASSSGTLRRGRTAPERVATLSEARRP